MTEENLFKPEPYKFNFCNKISKNEGPLLRVHIFSFKTKRKSYYIVEVEEYKSDFFAIKFYLKNESQSAYKFHNLSSLEGVHARKVIDTCIAIGLTFLVKNEKASFGFLGSPTKSEVELKVFSETKRFRVYAKFANFYFNPENFDHVTISNKSAYLIVNKKASINSNSYINDIIEMFDNNYNMDRIFAPEGSNRSRRSR